MYHQRIPASTSDGGKHPQYTENTRMPRMAPRMSIDTTKHSSSDGAKLEDDDRSDRAGGGVGDDDFSLQDVLEAGRNNEEFLPLPNRESFTSDLVVLRSRLDQRKRQVSIPCTQKFWDFVETTLAIAKPLGREALPDARMVEQRTLDETMTFIQKLMSTFIINPIHPQAIADASKVPLEDVLTELLIATKFNIVEMKFAPVCQRCGLVKCARATPHDSLPFTAACPNCCLVESIDTLEKIKVVFMLNPDIFYVLTNSMICKPSSRKIEKALIISPQPATYSGSGGRISIGCDKKNKYRVRPSLEPGRYRIVCGVCKIDIDLVVEGVAHKKWSPHHVELHVSDYMRASSGQDSREQHDRKCITVPHGKLRIDVFCDTNAFFGFFLFPASVDLVEDVLTVPDSEKFASTPFGLVMHHPIYKLMFERTPQEQQKMAEAFSKMVLTRQ